MKFLFLIILLSGSQGLAGSRASDLAKPKHAQEERGALAGILGLPGINLTVNSGNCNGGKNSYPVQKFVGEFLPLSCSPPSDVLLLHLRFIWIKNCTSILHSDMILPFKSLTTGDTGNYTCIWLFMNGTQVDSKSQTWRLKVKERSSGHLPKILRPQENDNIEVDVGKEALVPCIAEFLSKPTLTRLVWKKGNSSISYDRRKSVFCNKTTEQQANGTYHMIASLVFTRVSPEHLNTKYTCKLESAYPELINVSITLSQKGDASSRFLWLGLVAAFAVITSAFSAVFVKLRIDIVLFLRGVRSASSSVYDGKQYDAYIMYYKAASEEALTEEERRLIPHILESEFGFQLCLYERDILPGSAVQEAVLEHIGLSRRLVLLPGPVEVEQESWVTGSVGDGAGDEQGLLSGLHAALVERQTRLILVERAPRGELHSLPESLRLLARSGGAVAWRGERSTPLSSPFWKKLRYYMPARQSRKHREESMAVL